jgi:hypothetical protein
MSGLGRSGTGTLRVDGKEAATHKLERTLPMILQWDESFDIGSDTLTGVNDADYKPPFPLTAKLNKLTFKVIRPQLSEADIKKLEHSEAVAVDGNPIHHMQSGPNWFALKSCCIPGSSGPPPLSKVARVFARRINPCKGADPANIIFDNRWKCLPTGQSIRSDRPLSRGNLIKTTQLT